MPFTENFSVFLNPKEHGVYAALYTAQGGGASVDLAGGIFEADYRDPLGVIQGEGITFLYELAKTPGVRDGDTFVITPRQGDAPRTFLARICELDTGGGIGMVLVHLEEQ